jgi:GrpB-like predicted nucleotidyltransferase (UPF0157 family)
MFGAYLGGSHGGGVAFGKPTAHEHSGNTAIPALAAKPIIDILRTYRKNDRIAASRVLRLRTPLRAYAATTF